jgi:hypothetical protein
MKKYFHIRKPMRVNAELQVLDEPVRLVDATDLTAQTGLTGQETGLADVSPKSSDSAKKVDKSVKAEGGDWRIPIVTYLRNPDRGAERNIQHLAFKYVLLDDELYRCTTKDLLLKCLDSDQARVAMGEVHEGIC